jgi:Endonuclease/Exonuclease/phosphatase family.
MRPIVKFSGGKIVPRSDLRAGTALGYTTSRQSNSLNILQWNAGGLTAAKRTELEQIVKTNDIDIFCIMEANLTQRTADLLLQGLLLPSSRKNETNRQWNPHRR